MAIIDRIKFDGTANGNRWLIYKYPSEQFVLGSQLIVNQGQEALFFKGGEALDLFGPGTHTLSTGNLPILHKLVNLPFGGKTPFTAEVYYVNKTVKMDLNWGTSTVIPLEDPKYGLILNVGAYGQYGIEINDARLFVSRIIGAVPNGTMEGYITILKYFNGLINTKIKTVTAQYMIKQQLSFLEISAYLTELSEVFQKEINEEFERFGISVVNFYCESIAPKPEEYQKLKKYKEELALGEGFYQRRRALDIAEKMVSNEAPSEISNEGIRLEIGRGIAGQVKNIFQGFGQSMNPQTPLSQPSFINEEQVQCPKCGMLNNSRMKFCGSCGSKIITESVCPYCGAKNPAGVKFCGECGKSLISGKCSACGFENKPGMKFCGNCGQKL